MRYYFKNTFLRNYFKALNLSRTECCTNNTCDSGVKRRIKNLPYLLEKMQTSVENFLDFQAEVFNNATDTGAFGLLAKPVFVGKRRIPGLKLQDARLIRLLEVLLHDGYSLTEWTTSQLLVHLILFSSGYNYWLLKRPSVNKIFIIRGVST